MHRILLALLVLVATPGVASASLESFLSSVNAQARVDLPGFHATVSAQFDSRCHRWRQCFGWYRPPRMLSWSSRSGRWPSNPPRWFSRPTRPTRAKAGASSRRNSGSIPAPANFTHSRMGTSCTAILRRGAPTRKKAKERRRGTSNYRRRHRSGDASSDEAWMPSLVKGCHFIISACSPLLCLTLPACTTPLISSLHRVSSPPGDTT